MSVAVEYSSFDVIVCILAAMMQKLQFTNQKLMNKSFTIISKYHMSSKTHKRRDKDEILSCNQIKIRVH